MLKVERPKQKFKSPCIISCTPGVCLFSHAKSDESLELVKGQNQPTISPKRTKFQEILEKGEVDRISALPDCLILEILCRLPWIEDTIRTGTLSKRWKNLWTMGSNLVFYHDDDNHSWADFVTFVDKTLTQYRQLKLKKFEVYTYYYDGFASQVNNWIQYAVSRNVEKLNLSVWHVFSDFEFTVDQFFFTSSSFTDLTLKGCILSPTMAISWKNLRNLCISLVELDEDLIENILCGSPVLETLELKECYGYSQLDITSRSIKNLVFSGYMDTDDYDDAGYFTNIVEINAPGILSLTIQDNLPLRKLLLVNVSSLVEAVLDYTSKPKFWNGGATCNEVEEEMLKGLMLNLRHVKDLKIGSFCSEVLSRLEAKGFIFPSNVKKVVQVNKGVD